MKRSTIAKDRRSSRRKQVERREMPSLKKWLQAPDATARRGEVWNVTVMTCRLYELAKLRESWWWRFVPTRIQNRIIGKITVRMAEVVPEGEATDG